jgi:hypothetical protein
LLKSSAAELSIVQGMVHPCHFVDKKYVYVIIGKEVKEKRRDMFAH